MNAITRQDRTTLIRRLVVISLVTWPCMVTYLFLNRWEPARTVLVMPEWVPFLPIFALPYVGMLLATWLLPLAVRDEARFRACLVAMVSTYLLVMPWWILDPTTMPRPEASRDWWALPYHWLAAADRPNNVMPCAHNIGPMVAAWFAGRDRPSWRWPIWVLLILLLPAILFTWQHRPVDIVLGTLIAAVGVVVGEAAHRYLKRLPQRTAEAEAAQQPDS